MSKSEVTKQPVAGEISKRNLELLTLGLIALRDGLAAQAESLQFNPATKQAGDALQKQVDRVDYATTALAGELGWSIVPGSGANVGPALAEAAARWIGRKKQDPIPAPLAAAALAAK
jgi:hypothetical protein